jgi:hypothetical protein
VHRAGHAGERKKSGRPGRPISVSIAFRSALARQAAANGLDHFATSRPGWLREIPVEMEREGRTGFRIDNQWMDAARPHFDQAATAVIHRYLSQVLSSATTSTMNDTG